MAFMCSVWLSEQTVTFALYIANRLDFITEVESVYCAVGTESLCNTGTSRPWKVKICIFLSNNDCRSQRPRGLRCRSIAARLLRLWVRIPPKAWIYVCCECCVLSGRGLRDALITCPYESYRLWCVVMCDPETSRMKRSWPALGCSVRGKK